MFGIESDYARVILLKLHNQNNPDDRFFKQANTFIKDNTKKMEDEAMVAFKDEKESAVYAVQCAFNKQSGVVGLDEEDNDKLSIISFDRIKGGKPFNPNCNWFQEMLHVLLQTQWEK